MLQQSFAFNKIRWWQEPRVSSQSFSSTLSFLRLLIAENYKNYPQRSWLVIQYQAFAYPESIAIFQTLELEESTWKRNTHTTWSNSSCYPHATQAVRWDARSVVLNLSGSIPPLADPTRPDSFPPLEKYQNLNYVIIVTFMALITNLKCYNNTIEK